MEINAHQWAWQVRYAGPDGKFNTPDDVVTLNEVYLPKDAPGLFQVASIDVIHSFNVPNMRMKVDAVPGTINRMWFTPAVPGDYEIGCAQHCGANHYKMQGMLHVVEPGSLSAVAGRRLRQLAAGIRPPGHRGPLGLGLGRAREGEMIAEEQVDLELAEALQPIHHQPNTFFRKYIWSLDHKVIAKQYLWAGLIFLLVGGTLAMLIRWQWAFPGRPVPVLGPDLPPRLRRGDRPRPVHAGVHHARADHDLLRHHADPDRRVRQLLHPADDRRAGHGVPLAQRALLLGVRPRSVPGGGLVLR